MKKQRGVVPYSLREKSVKVDLSWRAWSLIVGFFILIGFVGLSLAIDPAIHGHPDQALFPNGAIMAFNLASCPIGWIPANGSTGTPDLRGVFIRGLNGIQNGNDTARDLGSYQADALQNHVHWYLNWDGKGYVGPTNYVTGDSSGDTAPTTGVKDARTATETRPKNIALLYCMKI